ncbi:hypothetical protein SASPL_104877 [Salvia splendens]|uniref:Protein kinase domain-containing protein n=2 Tax=Salvia splendens TaxID=180675 RepID=A0A8X8YKQ2_SALSN|nr:hypothetical protein SASPL_104877 [Salvia splendens]
MRVMHRDLKPENFLLSDNTEDALLKATDFGLSVFIEEDCMPSILVYASEDSVRGKNQKGDTLWLNVHKLYHEWQAQNPDEINKRNMDSLKGRWKRLNGNGNKWVAACRAANARKRSGMSDQDVENEAHSIYKGDGGNVFQDLIVFNEVMSKHEKWSVHDATQVFPDNENFANEQDGSSSKRTKTSESGEYTIPSNPETPTSGHSTSSRPIGRDKAKRKGKGKVTQSDSINAQCAADFHALRLAKDNENEIARARLQLEREKLDKPSMKMYQKMLLKLLEKEHLSPEDQDMKRNLTEIVLGK